MTKEAYDEAIRELEINRMDDTFVLSDKTIDMAIRALKQESDIAKVKADIIRLTDTIRFVVEEWMSKEAGNDKGRI